VLLPCVLLQVVVAYIKQLKWEQKAHKVWEIQVG